jgi:hypothetical protein
MANRIKPEAQNPKSKNQKNTSSTQRTPAELEIVADRRAFVTGVIVTTIITASCIIAFTIYTTRK